MPTRHLLRFAVVAALLVVACMLMRYRTDREAINLAPTHTLASVLPLEPAVTYEQEFTLERDSLTRLGIFFKPLRKNIPPGEVTITLFRKEEQLVQQKIASPFIDAEGFTQIRFSPLTTQKGERLRFTISAPEPLKGYLGILLRQPDESFNQTSVALRVNGEVQPAPLAYQAYTQYQPAFIVQVAILLSVAALLLLLPAARRESLLPYIGAIATGLLAIVPYSIYGQWLPSLFVAVAVLWLGLYRLSRQSNLFLLSAIFVANMGSFSTYLALHAQAGHTPLLLVSALPLVVSFLRIPQKYRLSVATALVAITGAGIGAVLSPTLVPDTASLKDIFLDPYQLGQAQKVLGGLPWFHYGSYIGTIVLALSFIGLLQSGWLYMSLLKNKFLSTGDGGASAAGPAPELFFTSTYVSVAVVGLVLLILHSIVRWLPLPLGIAYSIFGLTLVLSFLAGAGLEYLQKYLGNTRAVKVCLACVVLLSLLDQLFVLAGTLETLHL